MREGELPEEVRRLIQTSVPTIDALECFLLLVRHPERTWDVAELVAALGQTVVPNHAVALFLTALLGQGLVVEREVGRYSYSPATPALATAVQGLVKAYEERPVTLIRTVYAIADSRNIRGFADAFRFKTDKKDE